MVGVGVGDDNLIYDFVHRTDFVDLSLVIELWKLKCGNVVRDICHWCTISMSDLGLVIHIPVLDGHVQIYIYEGAFLVGLWNPFCFPR